VFLGAIIALYVTRNLGPREAPELLRGPVLATDDSPEPAADDDTPGEPAEVSVSADSSESSGSSSDSSPPPTEDPKP
jgi:hypothetical protein